MLPRKMLPRSSPDGIHITFDDHHLVANAGLLLPAATLAQHLGLPQLVQQRLDLGDAPGRANTGDKIVTLVASALAGGDCIDDADVLRTGGTAGVIGCVVKAPSTLGIFLRSFRWGHVRQLDRVSRELLARAWAAGAGPGDGPLTIDLDSTICETYGLAKEGGPPPQLYRPAGLSPAPRHRRRHRRRADGTTAPGSSQHGPGRGPLPAGNGGSGAPWLEPPDHSRCGPTAASMPTPWSRSAAQWMCASPSPSASTPDCGISSRLYPRKTGRPYLTGRRALPTWLKPPTRPFQSEPDAAPARLIVRGLKPTPGSQLALPTNQSVHAAIGAP